MALATTSVLFAIASCPHDKTDTDNFDSNVEVITTCTTTSITTSTLQKTTTTESTTTTSPTTTTELMTTTDTTATTIVSVNTPVIETQPYVVEVTTEVAVQPVEFRTVEIEPAPVWMNEDDVVLLAKLINHESSATYDGKVMVGSCVVNRMNAKGMSVSEVIYEPYQFTTAYSLTTYTDTDYQVAQQVLTQGSADSRIYFFNGCHPDCKNWFYDINYNYLGAW